MMNLDEKQVWIDALLSGTYQQGLSYLNAGGQFCCLGVKCEIDVMDGLMLSKQRGGRYEFEYAELDGEDFRANYPSPETYSRWGLNRYQVEELGQMNDTGKSFTEIAEWIRENL